MAKPTETRAPARAAKSPAARRRAAPSGNGRAPRSPAEPRHGPGPSAEAASAMRAEEPATDSAQKAEPAQASSAAATEASASQAAASAAPEPRSLSPAPVTSDDRAADQPTGAASEIPPSQRAEPDHRAEPPENAGMPADRLAARPGETEANRSAALPLAWLESSARLGDEMAGFARAQVEDAIATAQAMLTCGSLPGALELQASYAVRAMQGNVAQTLRLARLSAELMPAAFTPRKPL